MKLIIQIPCFNEEQTLPITIAELPRELPGIDEIEILIINDGSTDRTVETAVEMGVDHIVDLPFNQGLARAFMAGLEASLRAGADIIVNTDADNQYRASDIERLIQPILERRAQMVVGARPIEEIAHFGFIKKRLQRFGSWVVRVTSNTDISDAPSGFRAISRDAAMRLNVFNSYTYTLETIIQAGRRGIVTASVPIGVNGELRPSRLFKSIWHYVFRSLLVIVRIFMIYKPLRFFLAAGSVPMLGGILLGLRWLISVYLLDSGRSHLPSLILAAILMLVGFGLWAFGLVADLLAANRMLLEEMRYRLRRLELDRHVDGPSQRSDQLDESRYQQVV